MNTDEPTPASEGTAPGEPAAVVDEAAEPTVALSVSGDAEPTVMLAAAEISEATVDLSSPAASEPTVDLSTESADAESAPEVQESEPTVTLTAAGTTDVTAEAADETIDLSADDTADGPATDEDNEPTAVISAEAEPTIALPRPRTSPESAVAVPLARVSAPASEPTVALPKPAVAVPEAAPRPGSEPTVALPRTVSQPGSEPTVALPRTVSQPASASTVALPSVPAPRSPSTITPPPSEPTIALPAAPKAPAAVPLQAKPVSRRRLLWAIPAVAGTALAGGTIAALARRDTPEASKTPNLVVTEAAPAATPTAAPTSPQPTKPVMKVPVHTLKDFRAVVPGDPFPADAIALTIDDGPHPVWTPQILRLLEKHHVPALFCMIGNQVLGHEATAKDVVADGHHIANHTWSHPINVAELPARKALKEIHRAQDKIYSTTGYAPTLFRAPGGAWSPGLSESVSRSNVIPLDWTNDPRDWSMPGVAQITNRMLAARPGQILLCHDGGGDRSQTLASLKTVIPALQAQGLKFVALV